MKAAVAHIPRREGALWGRLLSKDVPLHREKGTDTHGCQPKRGGGGVARWIMGHRRRGDACIPFGVYDELNYHYLRPFTK